MSKMTKMKITFRIDGIETMCELCKFIEGELIGERRWKYINYLGNHTTFVTKDENGNIVEKHTYDRDNNEMFFEEEIRKDVDVEQRFNENGKAVYERDRKTGKETWSEYDNNGLLVHRKIPFGYEHFYSYYDDGTEKEFRIEKNGKIISKRKTLFSDDKRFKMN